MLVSRSVHPETRKVLATYLPLRGMRLVECDIKDGVTNLGDLKGKISGETAATLVQQPNFFGCLEEMASLGTVAKESGALFIVSANPIALALLEPPSSFGADIVVGEGQPLGNPLSFGGPGFGFFAVREKYMRKLPGRVVGKTTDREGKPCFVLTLQAREQHNPAGEGHLQHLLESEPECSHGHGVHEPPGTEGTPGGGGAVSPEGPCGVGDALCGERVLSPVRAPFFKEFALKSSKPVEKLNRHL